MCFVLLPLTGEVQLSSWKTLWEQKQGNIFILEFLFSLSYLAQWQVFLKRRIISVRKTQRNRMYDFPKTIALSYGASRFLDITDSLVILRLLGGWGRRILDVSRQNLRYLPIRLCNIFKTTSPFPPPPHWQLISTQFFIVHLFYSFSYYWFPHALPENRVIPKIPSFPPPRDK